ncbi:MAG: hypothetical protein AAGF23_26060, partial [Acidobacteriota bacterium]
MTARFPRRWVAALLATAAALVASTAGAQSGAGGSDGAPDPAPSGAQEAATPGGSEPGRVTVDLTPRETTVGGRVRAEITVVWMGGEPKEPMRFPTWQD